MWHPQLLKDIGIRSTLGLSDPCFCSHSRCGSIIWRGTNYYYTLDKVWQNGIKKDYGVFCSIECAYQQCLEDFPPGGLDEHVS